MVVRVTGFRAQLRGDTGQCRVKQYRSGGQSGVGDLERPMPLAGNSSSAECSLQLPPWQALRQGKSAVGAPGAGRGDLVWEAMTGTCRCPAPTSRLCSRCAPPSSPALLPPPPRLPQNTKPPLSKASVSIIRGGGTFQGPAPTGPRISTPDPHMGINPPRHPPPPQWTGTFHRSPDAGLAGVGRSGKEKVDPGVQVSTAPPQPAQSSPPGPASQHTPTPARS